ncbi:hypothetical protein [Natronomonas gomsonensis]|uniref:hypothetical protein n=1 Tax=Natronomonas gomsonensis TaxID=1046043 RepID=UPI0015BA35C3|nr:hypothetical protein [Natronomonas gomsonensis]
MGLFDKFTGGSSEASEDGSTERGERHTDYTDSDDYEAEGYTREDLSDEISVIFADRWPTGKKKSEYELIYGVDPNLSDPILLRCSQELFIPKGTKLLPFEEMTGLEVEGKTYWVSSAQLINPELAEFIDHDWEYKAPSSMEGRRVAPRKPDESEANFLRLLLSAF